jgi:2-hydroxy-3-oxopropionate reductase
MSSITSAESRLGFVGIGYMGRPIAQRLLQSGFRLTAYNRHRAKAEELVRYGGKVAESVAEPPAVTSCCRAWRVMKLF